MQKLVIVLTLFIGYLHSCEKNPSGIEKNYYEIMILGRGIDCGDIYLIKFLEKQNQIKSITNFNSDIFYADYLPEKFKQDSIIIHIQFRNPKDDEFCACTCLGPAYPHIIVTSIKNNSNIPNK